MTLDETLQKITAAPTVTDATTELIACVTTLMRDADAMSEWQALADALDAEAQTLAAAVAAVGAVPADPTPAP